MKKKFLLFLLLLIPFKVFALSNSYNDVAKDIVKVENYDEKKVTLYLFHGAECPHCEEERVWLKKIKKEYKKYLSVHYFEVWHNEENAKKMEEIKRKLGVVRDGVPLTIVGEKCYVGFSESISSQIENSIKKYSGAEKDFNKVKIPILGEVKMKDVSIPLVAVILGFIDGFNPCAMWILLFLINLLIGLKDKKKAWLLGFTFLLISGLVYFLSMLGINFVLGVATIKWLKILIALFILVAGVLNLNKYFKNRKEEAGCTVVDSNRRKKLIAKMKKIVGSNSFILSLIGIIFLAVSVNLIELACSLGFPVIFTEILSINKINGILKIFYLLIYIFFYMIDDLVVFSISMITLEATGITNKYSKLCTLVSAIIMIVMGFLLMFKSEWLMFNF